MTARLSTCRSTLGVESWVSCFIPHPFSFYPCPIFQIDFSTLPLILSAYKYFRSILKRPNEHISISESHYHYIETFSKYLRKEIRTSWTLPNDTNIWCKQQGHRYLQNKVFYFRNPISLSQSRYLELFSEHGLLFTMPKFSPDWSPVQPFLNIDLDYGNICFLKKVMNFFGCKIWVIMVSQRAKFLVLWV